MAGHTYRCPICKDHFLYAPSGLPAAIRDSVTCDRCGQKLEEQEGSPLPVYIKGFGLVETAIDQF